MHAVYSTVCCIWECFYSSTKQYVNNEMEAWFCDMLNLTVGFGDVIMICLAVPVYVVYCNWWNKACFVCNAVTADLGSFLLWWSTDVYGGQLWMVW